MNLNPIERIVRFLLAMQTGAAALMLWHAYLFPAYVLGGLAMGLMLTALLGVRPVVALSTFVRFLWREGFYIPAKD